MRTQLAAAPVATSANAPASAGPPTSRAVAVSELGKSYGALQAVRGVSFTVEHGEIFALLGPNSAGLPADAVPGDGLVTIETAQPTETLHQLTGWALRHGMVLDQLTVDRPSLEDIYLRLTSNGLSKA